MSQKNLKRKNRGTARAMPIETIITRFKSAQQKKQHEQNQKKTTKNKVYMKGKRSNRIQASIKSNNLKCIIKEKPTKSMQESQEIDKNEEYYPDKLRRPLLSKKVVLSPKPSYKLVGGLNNFNKRKLKKPIKEIFCAQQRNFNSSINNEDFNTSNSTSELSIIDMIRLQDSDSLDEDDFLEILTCPSPVWWEDPPDGYDEEPLSSKTQDVDTNKINQQKIKYDEIINEKNILHKTSYKQDKQNNSTSNALFIDVNIKDDKNYVNRRNKLESLLGKIKNIKTDTESNEFENKTNNSSLDKCERQKKTSESCDEEVLDESYDKILETFENIDIPIKDTSDETLNIDDKETNPTRKGETIKILKLDTEIKSPNSKAIPVKGITIKKGDIKKLKPNKKNVMTTDKMKQNISAIKKNKMLFLKGLSDLKINQDKNIEIKKAETSRCFSKEHYLSPVTELTIKNWDINLMKQNNKNLVTKNTKNMKRKSASKRDEVIEQTTDKIVHIENNNDIKSESTSSTDHVTVYKIINEQEKKNDTKIELNNEYNTQLNSYYNQCKNITKNKKEIENVKSKQTTSVNKNKKEIEDVNSKQATSGSAHINNSSIKSISVSDNETVKYCLQCSSIFDTDTCKYCAKKFKSDSNRQSSLNKDLKKLQGNEIL